MCMLILVCKINIHLFILQQLLLIPTVSSIHRLNISIPHICVKENCKSESINIFQSPLSKLFVSYHEFSMVFYKQKLICCLIQQIFHRCTFLDFDISINQHETLFMSNDWRTRNLSFSSSLQLQAYDLSHWLRARSMQTPKPYWHWTLIE